MSSNLVPLSLDLIDADDDPALIAEDLKEQLIFDFGPDVVQQIKDELNQLEQELELAEASEGV